MRGFLDRLTRWIWPRQSVRPLDCYVVGGPNDGAREQAERARDYWRNLGYDLREICPALADRLGPTRWEPSE